MINRKLSDGEATRLKEWMDGGLAVYSQMNDLKEEIKTIRGGLNDTTKELAESLDIEPKILKKALKSAFEASINEEKDTVNSVEVILSAVGQI